MKVRTTILLEIFLLAFFSIIMFSCTAGQPGVNGDESSLFGESSQGTQTNSDLSEEEEVLRLLGITDDEAQVETAQPVEAAVETQDDTNWEALENEVGRLEKEITQKDRELENLKEQLVTKDTEIQKKEQNLTDISYSKPVYSSQSTTAASQSATAAPQSNVGNSFKSSYDEALTLYRTRRYREAIEIFDQLLNMQTNTYSDNCQYWKGECYYGLLEYNQALIEFQKVFIFEKSNKNPDAQLKVGRCYEKMGQYEKARNEYQKLIDEYPTSEYVSRAQSYLSNL